MLLTVMVMAKADRPPVGWFHGQAAVSAGAYMRAFNWPQQASWYAAVVTADPRSMGGAATLVPPVLLALKPLG